MTRDEYKDALLANGFVFVKTQMGFPGRGEEDVYTHPGYKYQFYVTRVSKGNQSLYGFYTGRNNGKSLDAVCPRNAVDDYRKDRSLPMWVGDAFIGLMKHVHAILPL